MRLVNSMHDARNRAAEALKTVLDQVSQIKLKSIDAPTPDLKVDILAHVDVHGHRHTLACKINATGRPDHVRVALKELQDLEDLLQTGAEPVIIAPYFSEEMKALCGASKAGFLDMDGNAHLEVGDVFIVRRSQPVSEPVPAVEFTSEAAVPIAPEPTRTFTPNLNAALAGVA